MKRLGLVCALLLLVAVNAFVLAGIATNRSNQPEASLLLTERELPLAYRYNISDLENSGVSLTLSWHPYETDWSWLDAAKMSELGFDVRPLRKDTEDSRSYRRPLPKKVFAVLEYEGESWQSFRRKKLEERAKLPEKVTQEKLEPEAAERQRKQIDSSLTAASRLFAIDAGLDPQQLRKRYPDTSRYLITAAMVRLLDAGWYYRRNDDNTTPTKRGSIQSLLSTSIHVPLPHRKVLDPLIGKAGLSPNRTYYDPASDVPSRPRYRVRLNYGSRYEPWIDMIERIAE
ncbi:MAG: DUF4824 family protein [Desulfuromonadales bacterium]|nr:DUF4824 family protein [Desulfuromonadales bacterium]